MAGRLHQLDKSQLQLIVLNCIHIAICCISLVSVAALYSDYHISYHPSELFRAFVVILAFAAVSPLFAFARASFGYFLGFYFYTMILGYLWLDVFSDFSYNHALTGFSAAASAVAFLLPALFISSPVRQVYIPSPSAFDRLLTCILLLATATIAAGASYHFRFVSIENIYSIREQLAFPTILNYLLEITSNALLPFAFACFLGRRDFWRAGVALLLMSLVYPINLSKLALFTPVWLVAIALVSKIFDFKITVTLSVLVPVSLGIVLAALFRNETISYNAAMPFFGLINFRMIAIPSLAMDYYNYFFSTHDLTYFCQMRLLRGLVSCPYQEQLAVVMNSAFGIGGNFNASLFATEGIASVGPMFAPFTALACGLIIALGNRLSAGLPSRFVLISGAILVQAFLNVPLTTAFLTHGCGLLFLLWYVTPREMFQREGATEPETTAIA
jgi:hypothetical protein